MARELYNWDQSIAYSIVAIHNLKDKKMEVNELNFLKEVNTLQTMYGKDGIIGLARRYLKNINN